jgi:hypothetical protein
MATTDLTGGLDESREFLFAARPDDPEMRESVNMWLWDDGAALGLPRVGVEAVAETWDTHEIQLNLSMKGGRVLNAFGPRRSHDPIGADGRPRICGSGPLSFELVEPFRHWRARYEGVATETSVLEQLDGWIPGFSTGPEVPVAFELDLRAAAPPWESGSLLEEAALVLATQEEGDLMGGPRFEQLFRAEGVVRVGDDELPIRGGGLRVRRTGVRRLATFWGHAWQSAVFPSGRAFGHCVYPPRADGKPTFNEGFLFEGSGELIPARVVKAPWLTTLTSEPEDVSVVLETTHGTTTIEGETILATFMVMPEGIGPGLTLQQTIVRYSWDGETANGMLERSMPTSALARRA